MLFDNERPRFPITLRGGNAGDGGGSPGPGGNAPDGSGSGTGGSGAPSTGPAWLSSGWATGDYAPLSQSKALAEIKANTIEEALPLLAKGYDNQAKMIGDRVALPKPDATGKIDEKVQREFWTKLGVPINVDGYKDLRMEPIEGLGPMSEALVNSAKPVFLKHGLTPRQGQEMLNLYREVTSRQRRDLADNYVAGQAGLEEKWGLNFDKNFTLAQRAMKKYFPESFIKLLADSHLDMHSGMIEGLYNIGQNLAEADFIDGEEPTVADNEAVEKQIAELRDAMTKMNEGSPQLRDANAKMEALYKKRYGTGEAGPQR